MYGLGWDMLLGGGDGVVSSSYCTSLAVLLQTKQLGDMGRESQARVSEARAERARQVEK